MYCPPFGLVADFGKQQLSLSPDLPRFQSLAVRKVLLGQLPHNLACAIAACPLSIYVDVDIDIEASRNMHAHIRGRYGLTEGRSWGDWRKEGDDDLKRGARNG